MYITFTKQFSTSHIVLALVVLVGLTAAGAYGAPKGTPFVEMDGEIIELLNDVSALKSADQQLQNDIDNISLTPGPSGLQGPMGPPGPIGPMGPPGQDANTDELQERLRQLEGRLAGQDFDGDGVNPRDGDCNDSNAAIYPGAIEVLDDGVDNDCDGIADMLQDQDGDGFFSNDLVVAQRDCDDGESSIFPGATEILGNDADEDCNGVVQRVNCDAIAPLGEATTLINLSTRRDEFCGTAVPFPGSSLAQLTADEVGTARSACESLRDSALPGWVQRTYGFSVELNQQCPDGYTFSVPVVLEDLPERARNLNCGSFGARYEYTAQLRCEY